MLLSVEVQEGFAQELKDNTRQVQVATETLAKIVRQLTAEPWMYNRLGDLMCAVMCALDDMNFDKAFEAYSDYCNFVKSAATARNMLEVDKSYRSIERRRAGHLRAWNTFYPSIAHLQKHPGGAIRDLEARNLIQAEAQFNSKQRPDPKIGPFRIVLASDRYPPLAWIRSTPVANGILAGSPDCEREFAERFLPRLQLFFRARLANPELREEVTQETLVAALVALRAGKLREPGAMEAFVLGIARNLLAEALRQQAKDHSIAIGTAIEHRPIAPELAPEWQLAVRNELQELPPTDQRILWLILIEGFRPAEVAPQVGLTEEAVRQRKSRLLRQLHEKFFGSAVTDSSFTATLPRRGTPKTAP